MGHLSSSFLAKRPRSVAVFVSVLLLGAALVAPAVWSAVDGGVSGAIEIDGTTSANLYPGNNTCDNGFTGSALDWVADCAATVANPKLVVDGPGTVTSRTGGTGNWNGVRIVDGIAGAENNIFLTGGKENDVSTWNVGPGTVGSSKYDATQAYLANTQTQIFFGMERRGNNGTTAFDFEFNQYAPAPGENYIPTRTSGDVLLTFELNGSGGSGSATAHYFTWDADHLAYVEGTLPDSARASINDSLTTPAGPWGHVNSKGKWEPGNLARFEFGEAQVPLSILPGVDACGGKAYVQVRTRSSATDTSDLKDTTKIFEYEFQSVEVTAAKQNPNAANESVDVKATATGVTAPSYEWFKSTNGAAWEQISGTTDTLTYANFVNDDQSPATVSGSFNVAGDIYVGKVYEVQLKARAYKTTNGLTCEDFSDAVTVKKLIAVDP